MLATPTAKLIEIIWNRFAHIYNEGINEVLDKGLATTLASPYEEIMIRSFRVYQRLVANPQFLADCFVNYDCDHSGVFKNIFENTVRLIVRQCYPEDPPTLQHKPALRTLTAILENLWKDFESCEDKAHRADEVQLVLDQKKAKVELQTAQEVFKQSPSKGLLCFAEIGLCEGSPQGYANFLFDTPTVCAARDSQPFRRPGGRFHLRVRPTVTTYAQQRFRRPTAAVCKSASPTGSP
jgi:hypothetical protein